MNVVAYDMCSFVTIDIENIYADKGDVGSFHSTISSYIILLW